MIFSIKSRSWPTESRLLVSRWILIGESKSLVDCLIFLSKRVSFTLGRSGTLFISSWIQRWANVKPEKVNKTVTRRKIKDSFLIIFFLILQNFYMLLNFIFEPLQSLCEGPWFKWSKNPFSRTLENIIIWDERHDICFFRLSLFSTNTLSVIDSLLALRIYKLSIQI
jgi:hypothetical protein